MSQRCKLTRFDPSNGKRAPNPPRRSSRGFCKEAGIDPAMLGDFTIDRAAKSSHQQYIVISDAATKAEEQAQPLIKTFEQHFLEGMSPLSDVFTDVEEPLQTLTFPPAAFAAADPPPATVCEPPTPISAVPTSSLDQLIDELCQMNPLIPEIFWAGDQVPDHSYWNTPSPIGESLVSEPLNPPAPSSSLLTSQAVNLLSPTTSSQPFFPEWVSERSSSDMEQSLKLAKVRQAALEETLTLKSPAVESSEDEKLPSHGLNYAYSLGWPLWANAAEVAFHYTRRT